MVRPQSRGISLFKEKHRVKSWWMPWAIATAVVLVAVGHHGGASGVSAANSAARIGSPAPDFTLRLLDGKSVSLLSLKGKPVVVNFWHSG